MADPLRRIRHLLGAAIAGGEIGRARHDATQALEQRTSELLRRQDTVLGSYDRRVASIANRLLAVEERLSDGNGDADDANAVISSHARDRLPQLDLRRPVGVGATGSAAEPDTEAREVADLVGGHPPVLDLAAGDGHLLRLLQVAGVEATGVESDPVTAARLRVERLNVVSADMLVELAGRPDGSVGAIVAGRVVEYLDVADVGRLLVAARRALRPGGLLVLDSTYPESERSVIAFWRDPARLRPYDPSALAALAERAGMKVVDSTQRPPGFEDYRLVCST